MDTPQINHRQLGVDLFNETWSLIDKPQRTREEDDQMIHTAHASRFHWGKVGTPTNFARGEWQISRVYAVLGRSEPALHHAQRTLDLCQENGIGDFDLAFAYEALARASHIAGKPADRERYRALALAAGEKIAEEDDKNYFLSDLQTIPREP
jgi:hypothetical protein